MGADKKEKDPNAPEQPLQPDDLYDAVVLFGLFLPVPECCPPNGDKQESKLLHAFVLKFRDKQEQNTFTLFLPVPSLISVTKRNIYFEAKDQLTRERGICLNKNCDVRKFFLLLKECTIRVKAKPFTAETCHQEMVDLVHSIDRCVADKAFVKFA